MKRVCWVGFKKNKLLYFMAHQKLYFCSLQEKRVENTSEDLKRSVGFRSSKIVKRPVRQNGNSLVYKNEQKVRKRKGQKAGLTRPTHLQFPSLQIRLLMFSDNIKLVHWRILLLRNFEWVIDVCLFF